MAEAFICDYIRTPIGRFGGALSSVRTDDLGALPLKALQERNANVDWEAIDDVLYGCANQAGEDNRNVARMATLLSGLPQSIPGATINRLCGSGMNAVIDAARTIKAGEADIIIAGGVESMTRIPMGGFNPMPNPDLAESYPQAYMNMGITAEKWLPEGIENEGYIYKSIQDLSFTTILKGLLKV